MIDIGIVGSCSCDVGVSETGRVLSIKVLVDESSEKFHARRSCRWPSSSVGFDLWDGGTLADPCAGEVRSGPMIDTPLFSSRWSTRDLKMLQRAELIERPSLLWTNGELIKP